ncbi:YCF48-related protein [Hymenobacter edaphi]|uniref:Photosynthesis system II assembly factor Ycf48/Hcf136-like domain-containing protein n=1 Tax=Hymenobacter edaphi TaxID=2211146 RepID=A0A328BSS8_9BACT|nr:YCF48-related protein [Hymenobacter edaphi]RAK70167.1 hypothetical protein DLM85_04775 [Hymenobacter edaphi]
MKKLYLLGLLLSLLAPRAHAQWQRIYPLGLYANDVFFVSDQTGYVGGSFANSRAALFRTTDSGRTWQALTLPGNASRVQSVCFTAADTGYALTDVALLKTTNGGQSWQASSVGLGAGYAHRLRFTSARIGYLNTFDGVVYKTTDAGASWRNLNVPHNSGGTVQGDPSTLSMVNNQVGYLAVDFSLYKTTDGGGSWQRLGLQTSRFRTVHFRTALEGYAVTSFNGTYQTQDGGLSWTRLPVGNSATLVYFLSAQRGLFFSNYSYINLTQDGGQTSPQVYQSGYTFSWTGVHFPTPAFGCAVGNDGAIVLTRDGGQSWQMVNPASTNLRDNYALHVRPNGEGLVVGEAAGLLRTTDAGRTWSVDEQTLRQTSEYGLYFAGADTGMVQTVNNGLYFTYDGGRTFDMNNGRSGAFIGHQSSSDYALVSGRVIYSTGGSVGSPARIAKSTNGGRTWTYAPTTFQNRLASLSFPTPAVGYACGLVGKVVKTTDAGASWQEVDPPVNNDLLKVRFRSPAFGLAVGTFGGIVRTVDGGANWTVVPSGLTGNLIALHFFSDSLVYVGNEVGDLARSSNGGRSWRVITTAAERVTDLRQYHFRDVNSVLALGRTALYQRDLTDRSGAPLAAAAPAARTGSLRLYPNPVRQALTLAYPPGFVPTSLWVYDAQGRCRRRLAPARAADRQQLDVATLPAGMYLLRVEDARHTILTTRFIKE